MLSFRPESWFPHAQFSLCRKWVMQCNDSSLLESSLNYASLSVYVGYSQRFSGTVADESDTSQTPEKRSCSLVVLLNGSSHFIYLFPISSSSLVTYSSSANRTFLKTLLCLSLTLFLQRVYYLSFCVWVYVFFTVPLYYPLYRLSVQFFWYHSSFRNWLSYDNSEGVIQYCCSKCFDVWKEACIAYMMVRMKHEQERN